MSFQVFGQPLGQQTQFIEGDTDSHLRKIIDFFVTEDIHTTENFTEKHATIGEILRTISADGEPFGKELYEKAENMFHVHQWQIDAQAQNPPPPLPVREETLLKMLDKTNPFVRETPELRTQEEGLCPFTTGPEPDQKTFLATMNDQASKASKELRRVENLAYEETLLHPSLVNTHSQYFSNFTERARKRGSRRAALQIALRSLAQNKEHHHKNSWNFHSIQLPKDPEPALPEVRLAIALPDGVRIEPRDPFEFTKKYFQLARESKIISDIIQAEDYIAKQSVENYADVPIVFGMRSGIVTTGRISAKVFTSPALPSAVHKIRLEKRQYQLRKTMNLIRDEALLLSPFYKGGKKLPKNKLVTLSDYFSAGVEYTEMTGDEPDFPKLISENGAEAEIPLINEPLTPSEQMKLRNLSSTSKVTSRIERAELKSLAFRLGRETTIVLAHLVEPDALSNKIMEEQKPARELAEKTRLRLRSMVGHEGTTEFMSIIEAVQPLNVDSAELTVSQATDLLRNRVIEENFLNARDLRLNHAKLWSFADKVVGSRAPKVFFSKQRCLLNADPSDRPVPLESEKVPLMLPEGNSRDYVDEDEAIAEFILRRLAQAQDFSRPDGITLDRNFFGEVDGGDDSQATDPQERHVNSDKPSFPFVEHASMQELVDEQIEREMNSAQATEEAKASEAAAAAGEQQPSDRPANPLAEKFKLLPLATEAEDFIASSGAQSTFANIPTKTSAHRAHSDSHNPAPREPVEQARRARTLSPVRKKRSREMLDAEAEAEARRSKVARVGGSVPATPFSVRCASVAVV
ncbi:MAG: hypothetical protein M1829_003333 [Trizodia sp. TS-e1964]|nr:MAG: hypothetical protein M1829_003333 [Trizodia sp. TS-e1964]